MLDFAFGTSRNDFATDTLVEAFEGMDLNGTLYVGYPLLASYEGIRQLDALLTCEEHGVIAFDLSSSPTLFNSPGGVEKLEETQNDIWVNINNKLTEHKTLRKGRGLSFEVRIVSFFPNADTIDLEEADDSEISVATPSTLMDVLQEFEPIPQELIKPLNAAIQHTTTIKPVKKRAGVTRQGSKGDTLKKIEAEIANLDAWQKRGAIEYPEGPQRIRGLAGSGKTIVLAQKAAFLHAKYPDWQIAVTFQTRSLYQQFRDLIRKFSFDLIRDEPDWDKLRVIHAWGSNSLPGVYSEISKVAGHIPEDFGSAKSRYGASRAFQGVCKELNEKLKKTNIEHIFDAVLIDEAQDLPTDFFQIVYEATSPPKRIIWAYDELQNLSEYTMPPAEELFGKDDSGQPLVQLRNQKGRPQQDIVLPVCYRNTPWTLTMAHALGFGVYREEGLVQMFDDPSLWDLIGYELTSGRMVTGGQPAIFKRKQTASPNYFSELLEADEAFAYRSFDSSDEEYDWIAEEIHKNLTYDELEPDDILVIGCNALSMRTVSANLMKRLKEKEIPSHLAGVTTSRDKLFYEKSVAITSIYRAKGNEAPVVYVVGAEACYQGLELSKKRNTLFTAITRSRAWVRVTGSGQYMQNLLQEEIEKVKQNNFELRFRYPTQDEIEKLKRIHRDMTQDEKIQLENDLDGFARIMQRINDGELNASSLSEEQRIVVERLLQADE